MLNIKSTDSYIMTRLETVFITLLSIPGFTVNTAKVSIESHNTSEFEILKQIKQIADIILFIRVRILCNNSNRVVISISLFYRKSSNYMKDCVLETSLFKRYYRLKMRIYLKYHLYTTELVILYTKYARKPM